MCVKNPPFPNSRSSPAYDDVMMQLSLTALKTILSSPPTANFFGKTSLEVSSAPISQMCEDPSIAFNRTYSGVSESSLFSPSSSMDSRQLRKALDRGKSVDSNPVLENQSSGCLDEASDPDTSLTYLQQSSRNSSISIFSPSGMPKRDPSGILFTVPEHTDFLSGEFTQEFISFT